MVEKRKWSSLREFDKRLDNLATFDAFAGELWGLCENNGPIYKAWSKRFLADFDAQVRDLRNEILEVLNANDNIQQNQEI